MLTDHPEQPNLPVGYVTHEYFGLLGARYIHGSGFTTGYSLEEKIPEVVINFDAWVNWFDKANDVVGKVAKIGDVQFKVVGVLDQSFIEYRPIPVLDSPQIWIPWSYSPISSENWSNSYSTLTSLVKLSENQTLAQAEGRLSSILEQHFQSIMTTDRFIKESSVKIILSPLKEKIVGDSSAISFLLFFGAASLLLIACSNILNLFLSRAIEKSRDLAIKAAVGAKPKHIFSSMFAESLILTMTAMLLGLIVCAWCWLLSGCRYSVAAVI